MCITIQARGFDLPQSLPGHIERRWRVGLSSADRQLCAVSVCLSSANDQRCPIRIKRVGARDVVIEASERDFYVAIDRAADRTERTVGRRFVRWRKHRRDFLYSAT